MLKKVFPVLAIAFAAHFPVLSQACTVAFENGNPIAKTVARSMDLYVSDMPLLTVYPRGMQRTGDTGKHALQWQSKYGSVVVTAFRADAVSDGMNEHGLSAHLLYLDGTQYEKKNKKNKKRATLSNVQWVTYMLDNFKTVEEALKSLKQYRIVSTKLHDREWPVHLSLEDASGDSAIIEFIKGKMVVHHGKQYTVMTNEPAYDVQLKNLKQYKLFGGSLPLPGDVDPLSRFVRASTFLKTLPAPQNQVEAIAGIASVMRTAMVPFGAEDTSGHETTDSWPTRWITLADLTNRVYYFSATQAPNIVWLDLNGLDFSASTGMRSLDPTRLDLVGEVSSALKK